MDTSRTVLFRLLVILTLSILYACGESPDSQQADERSIAPTAAPKAAIAAASDETLALGKQVYGQYCLTCHQADGKGVPRLNPPLNKTEWVNGDKNRLIGIVVNGLSEKIEVKGETYSNLMGAHDFLSHEEIAAVLSYVRQSFGNTSSEVTVAEVAAFRGE